MIDQDRDLIQKSKSGDKKAFGKLVNRYYEMVYAVSYGVLHNRESARDVTQNVFMKVFRDIDQFEGKSKFKTWLYRVAVNAALDEVRKKKPIDPLDVTEDEESEGHRPITAVDQGASPRDVAARHELRALLNNAIEKLSLEHRAVLVLREWKEMSYEEIAETLGVELGTVMSRLHYARKQLGKILEDRSLSAELA